MIIIFKEKNKKYTAYYKDKNGFKTHFGPYPDRQAMSISVAEYFEKIGKTNKETTFYFSPIKEFNE